MKLSQLCLVAVPYRGVLAFPLAYSSTVSATHTYVPLIVTSICLFFLVVVFLTIKLVYMKHRRMGTIHIPPIPTTTNLDQKGNHHRGLLVGCLGSPTWETNLISKPDGAWRREQRRRSSFAYQLHASSSSRFTKSTGYASYSGRADQLALPSASSRVVSPRDSGSSKVLLSVRRHTSTNGRPSYGDFGEFHSARSPNIARRASPCSIRLVDGPSHSNHVEYSFLSVLPLDAVVKSPLMGTRDSFQLSRCSLKCHRKPAPPLPSLPSFLPFRLPKGPESVESRPLEAREYLPPLRFSPLGSVAKVFHSQHHVLEKRTPGGRIPDPDGGKNVVYSRGPCLESTSLSKNRSASNAGSSASPCPVQELPTLHLVRKMNTESNHKRSQSCRGLAIGRSLPQATLVTDDVATRAPENKRCAEIEATQTGDVRTPPGSSRSGSVVSKKPLKPCLRQRSPVGCSPDSMLTPSTSTQTYGARRSTGDQASIRTPISDDDIGMLGLDRFRWNDEAKELRVCSCHMKKDSVALVPL